MGTPYLGELRIWSFNFAPKNWAMCNGQTMPINQFQALFSLLGTFYGGNGTTTFQLPDLRGRIPLHFGAQPGESQLTVGQQLGEENHTVTLAETPAHAHLLQATAGAGTTTLPAGNVLAATTDSSYATTLGSSPVTLAGATLTTNGSSQPHSNQQPYLVLNIAIAVTGLFPSRN
jgi:microcystin-dependent protein